MKRKYLIVLLLISILGASFLFIIPPQIYFWYTKKTCERESVVNKEACYSQKLSKASFERGEDFAYKLLYLLKKESESIPWCHSIAHGIGLGLYRRSPESWQGLLSRAPQDCSYGLAHGILEEKILSILKENSNFDFLPMICLDQPDNTCNHILGHMLLFFNNLDIEKSLEMCSVLPNSYEINLCVRGVFMEYITGFSLVAHGLVSNDWLNWEERLDELAVLCNSFDEENSAVCWQELAHAVVKKFGKDTDRNFEFCQRAKSYSGRVLCKEHSIEISRGEDSI